MQHDAPRPPAEVDVSKVFAIGVTLALSTLGFLWLGTLVDGWLGTEPLFTVLGAFVGGAAGFYNMIHHLVTVPRREASRRGGNGEREREERSGRDGK